MGNDTSRRRIEWQLVGPGAVLLLLGLVNAIATADGPAYSSEWGMVACVAIGGLLLVTAAVRALLRR